MIDPVTQDTLYGNEWIDFDRTYYKIPVAEDGLVRIGAAQLPAEAAGVSGQDFRLYRMGETVPVYSTASGTLSDGDYLEFYGEKNRSELDRFLWADPENGVLNPEVSLFTDTAAYYLVWDDGSAADNYQMVDNDLNGSLPTAEAYFEHREQLTFRDGQTKKYVKSSGYDIYYSHFDNGEGFATALGSANPEMILEPQGVHPSSTEARVGIRFATNVNGHYMRMDVNDQPVVEQQEAAGYQLLEYTPLISFTENTGPLTVTLTDLDPENTNRQAIARVWVDYRRSYDFGGANFFSWTVDNGGEVYLEITGFDQTAPVLYDLTNKLRIEGTVEDGVLKLALPEGTAPRRLVLSSGAEQVATAAEPVQFVDYTSMDAQMVILSHPNLMAGSNPVQQYADYRSSRYTTAVVNILDLYEQFGYGVQRTPLAIRNFAHYIKKNWSDPRYFFIVGKAREYPNMRTAAALEDAQETYLVPTWGYPGSDVLLMADHASRAPMFSIGRLSVTTPQQVENYLDKVMGHESALNLPQTLEAREWTKQFIHIGGSGDPGEQQQIVNGFANMSNAIEYSRLLGRVTTVLNTTSDPVSSSRSALVYDRINEGTSWITFFGHSSAGAFSFDIDDPASYDNENKYPMMLSLGCFSGNIFTSGVGVGERFLNYEKKGAILYGATRGFGFVNALSTFGKDLYNYVGNEDFARPVGDAVRHAMEFRSQATDLGMATLMEQFILSGDPTVQLAVEPGADLLIDYHSANVNPDIVRLQADTFDFSFDLVNIGEQTPEADSVRLRISQQLPGGRLIEHGTFLTDVTNFRTPIEFSLPTGDRDAIGPNRMFVEVDPDNSVPEPGIGAEANNSLVSDNGAPGFDFVVTSNTIRPSYPLNYGIVGESPELVAVTSDYFAPLTNILWQIDTTKRFDSPMLRTFQTPERGGVVRWTPDIPMQEGVVYFWRVAPEATDGLSEPLWGTSSFTYLPDSGNGWSQSVAEQYAENVLNRVELDSTSGRFEFTAQIDNFRMKNKYKSSIDPPNVYRNNERVIDYFRWMLPYSVNISAFDPTGRPMLNPVGGMFGAINSQSRPYECFVFRTNTAERRAEVIDFLENQIPDGYRVIVFTALTNSNIHGLKTHQWQNDSTSTDGTTLFNVLESRGATRVRELADHALPYIFVYEKGGDVVTEIMAEDEEDAITWNDDFLYYNNEGEMTGSVVGPASAWRSLEWETDELFIPQSDSTTVVLTGIAADQTETVLAETYLTDGSIDLTAFSAATYPTMRLSLRVSDDSTFTSPQLNRWTVLYDPVPDLVFDPSQEFSFESDTLDRGKTALFRSTVSNLVPNTSMDDVLFRVRVRGANSTETILEKRVGDVEAGTDGTVEFEVPTRELTGDQQLIMELNAGREKQEATYANNFLQQRLHVRADLTNPTMEVTFDGVRIMPNDIVSAEPMIRVEVKDENQYLLLTDSALFDLRIVDPEGTETIYTEAHPDILFTPASDGANNRAVIEFTPNFTLDGTYRMSVQSRDFSDNASGSESYETTFEVVTSSTVSNVVNYPNPFTTSTRFVYTLTGSDTDMDYRIRIFSASGRIVRELGPADLGDLRIGTHQTDGSWDGTDTYGDRLAKGVYFYRFELQDRNGEAIEQRENLALDRFFEQGFGKLVIL